MKTTIELDVEKPDRLKQILGPSLETDSKVGYELKVEDNALVVTAETESLGPLRGCSDTVFRLASLATKLY